MTDSLNEVVRGLVDLVEQEIETYSEILNVLLRQRRSVVDRALGDFEQSVLEQERLVGVAKSLERQRIIWMEAIGDQLHIPSSELTLTRLIQEVGGKYSETLASLKQTLSTLAQKVSSVNNENKVLIERSLDFVERNIQFLVGLGQLMTLNSDTGRVEPISQGVKIIDTKA